MFLRRLKSACGRLLVSLLAIGAAAAPSSADSSIWHVKAIHPDGHLLRIKAIDAEGTPHDVKAIEHSGNRYLLDVKAFVNGEVLAVKVLHADDWFGPVKAVRDDGSFLDIKALTDDDRLLDVKAVTRAGNVLDIKAIGGDERLFYGVKAVSPSGRVYDVKGLKMSDQEVELEIGGTPIRAHIKAMPQVP